MTIRQLRAVLELCIDELLNFYDFLVRLRLRTPVDDVVVAAEMNTPASNTRAERDALLRELLRLEEAMDEQLSRGRTGIRR